MAKFKQSDTRQQVEFMDPPITVQAPPVEERKPEGRPRFWPKDKPMPTHYVQNNIPCPEWRRLLMDDGGRAVSTMSLAHGIAYLRCRVCGHRWKMEIRK